MLAWECTSNADDNDVEIGDSVMMIHCRDFSALFSSVCLFISNAEVFVQIKLRFSGFSLFSVFDDVFCTLLMLQF